MLSAVTPFLSPVRLLSVASEMFPFVKTGGLGDVTGSLPRALAPYGVEVTTLLPGYPAVMAALRGRKPVGAWTDILGHAATLWSGRAQGLDLLVLDAPTLFDRPGNPYLCPDGQDWPDNGIRFAVLSRMAADIAQGRIAAYHPDLVQAHDWQAGLTAAYLHHDRRAQAAPGAGVPVVQTIHNLAFQGRFPAACLAEFGLPPEAFSVEGCECYGALSFLKAGLYHADRITTVSPSYAHEIQTPEGGMGLDGLLRQRGERLEGILNGINTDIWNPASDPAVHFPYVAGDTVGRAPNKRDLQAEFGLVADPDAFVIGIVSRLTAQKGIDLLNTVMPRLLVANTQVIVVGEGDREIERGLAALQRQFPRRFACHLGYSEELGHRVPSAADAFLIPSRFEPCGLTQLGALRYGAVPIASRVGGLADTIIDANPAALARGGGTGFLFSPVDGETLVAAVNRARLLYRRQRAIWRQLQLNGAGYDVSWNAKAAHYVALFAELLGMDLSAPQAPSNVIVLPPGRPEGRRRRIARRPPRLSRPVAMPH
ncbi:starch synthase [Komagataeibacter rhaeticus]|uniref:glycogen synthase GlgA n=2 Tax=Komagataeibacter rhaeticus TaxID=215221 RepID=UPI0004D4A821|nr:glycogen synthase GlgA [Komagataeibacter rhaeticus]KDU95452.1 glycogen synthase [Komagataeibacter rhaeticus AF1]MBL7239490.1 glycogen synthase GlgA [Komagataeibacter rhaeticus]PYD54303.1 starch synthase [Komagataeibacter rhaeticus]GBQ14797.1 glycogen/starch synthase [Komagataeibacter rhaeticus DSM 16663]